MLDTSGINYAWQKNTDASGGETGDRGSYSSWNSDIGIPIHFPEESGIVTFGSIEFCVPLEVSNRCDSPCPDEAGNRVFSRVSTGNSEIPSSFEMKDKPAFNPVQGNTTLFLVRASRYPLHLRQKNQGPSHITIAEGRLLFRYLFKVGLTVQ